MERPQQQMIRAQPLVAAAAGLVHGEANDFSGVVGKSFKHGLISLSVFCVDGLPRDAQGVTDLLPGPSLLSGSSDLRCLDLFCQAMEGADRPQTDGGVE